MPRDRAGVHQDNDAALYGRLAELLAAGERFALCTLLRLSGSGPRRPGAKMLVRGTGETAGSVGGGLLEKTAVTWALEALRTGRAACRLFALDLEQASDEGMTCGGQIETLVEPLDGASPDAPAFFGEVSALLSRGGRGFLVTAIRPDGEKVVTERVLGVEGRPAASLPGSGRSVPEELLRSPVPPTPSLLARGDARYFLEPLRPPITVMVFGGGHIAACLVPLCRMLGFRTVVVDDRAEFVSRDRFPQADDLCAVSSFEGALEDLSIGEDSYVVIVTRGHGGDQAILRQALSRTPAFVGMIGSARKRALIYEQLAREGVTAEALARVACPIGLSIGAETPEEIAVSIAAQLVAARAARGDGG